MSKPYLLGTDIGTQGTKTVVVSSEGKILGYALEVYELSQPKPLWAEQCPKVWEEATYKSIRKSLKQAEVNPKEVAAICISGLYGGSGIPVDKELKPLRPCLIWMDRRAIDEVKWIKEEIDLDEVFRITGNYVDTYFGYPKILWIKNKEPEIWDKIYKFIPPSSYIEYKLTRELAVDYSSAGNLGGVFDIHSLEWSTELCKKLGIPREMMPDNLVKSEEVIGEITTEAAEKCGLQKGTPVVAGGIDAAMASLSSGAFEEGDNVAMMGTSTCWGVIHKGENLSKKLVSMPHVANSTEEIYSWGGSATSGALARWFRDQFCKPEVKAGEKVCMDPFKLLDMQAEKIPPGSEGLVVLPYFMGERSPIWDPEARGTIVGLTLYHKKAHLFRALMEAAAYSLRHNMEVGDEIGLPVKKECCVVGGVSKSKIWTKILADVTGRQMVVPSGGVGAPLGDALIAGIGVGIFDSYDVIKNWTSRDRVDKPNPGNQVIYDKYYKIYRKLYEDIKEDMHNLSEIKGD